MFSVLCVAANAQTNGQSNTTELSTVTSDTIRLDIKSEKYDIQKHSGVPFRTGADYELLCDVYVPVSPEGKSAEPFPAVLAVHGGAWRFGSRIQLIRQSRRFCQAGFVVVSIDYRLAPRWKHPAQLADCFAALAWMNENCTTYSIDPDQIFGYGYSAGGHLISLLALTAPEDWEELELGERQVESMPRLQAVAVGGTPFNLTWFPPNSPALDYWLGATLDEDPERYRAVSPASYLHSQSPPFYIFHADQDAMVPLGPAAEFHHRLAELDVETQFREIPLQGHLGGFNDSQSIEETLAFFCSHCSKAAEDADQSPKREK